MKLSLGNHLIETDYIESVERLAAHSVKICFVSGRELIVTCGVKPMDGDAQYPKDANTLMNLLRETSPPTPKGKRRFRK